MTHRNLPSVRVAASFPNGHPAVEPLEARSMLSVSLPAPKSLPTSSYAAVQVSPASAAVGIATELAATTTVIKGKTYIDLTWKNNEPAATGYIIIRAVGPTGTFTSAGKVVGASTTRFLDPAPIGNITYAYRVLTVTAAATGVQSSTAMTLTAPSAPKAVMPQMAADTTKGGSYVALYWQFADKTSPASYNIFRAVGNGSFSKVASSQYPGYEDRDTQPDTTYRYQVQAVGRSGLTSPLSAVGTLTTQPAIPTDISAAPTPTQVTLRWTVSDPAATGYIVSRSTDGQNYAKLTQLKGPANQSFTDRTLKPGNVAFYRISTTGPGGVSMSSESVQVRLPVTGLGSPLITTRFASETVIYDSASDDTISISQSGKFFLITANNITTRTPVTTGGLFVYLREGTDTVTINSTVTVPPTVQAIDGSSDNIRVDVAAGQIWMDADDSADGLATVHAVEQFAGDVAKSPGESLPLPDGPTSNVALNLPLFGGTIGIADAAQGQVGDCYLIAALSALAGTTPSAIYNSVVDMGDGTYTVRFFRDDNPEYYRVSNVFPTAGKGLTNLYYGRYGGTPRLWAPVIEKAFTYFHKGQNSYASINGGSFGDILTPLNVPWANFRVDSLNDQELRTRLTADLASGKAVMFATSLSPANLVRAHAYSLISVTTVKNVNYYNVRNPWNASGNRLEDRSGIATLTYAQLLANFAGGTRLT